MGFFSGVQLNLWPAGFLTSVWSWFSFQTIYLRLTVLQFHLAYFSTLDVPKRNLSCQGHTAHQGLYNLNSILFSRRHYFSFTMSFTYNSMPCHTASRLVQSTICRSVYIYCISIGSIYYLQMYSALQLALLSVDLYGLDCMALYFVQVNITRHVDTLLIYFLGRITLLTEKEKK